jgi:hypothetical protein
MKIHKLLIIAVITVGFTLRVLPVKWGLPSDNLALSSCFPDEQESFHSLERMRPAKLEFNPGPLLAWGSAHTYLLGITMKAAGSLGVIKIGSREYYLGNLKELDKLYILGRLISVIAGTISIWLIYLVILSLFQSVPAALLGGFIFAIVPLHLMYSFYIRPDVPMLMLALGVMFLSIRILETGARKTYLLCGALAGLMISAKYSGGAYIVFPVIAHFLYSYRAKEPAFGKVSGRNLLLAVFASLAVFALTCPYCFTPYFIYWVKVLLSQARSTAYWQPGWIMHITYLLPTGMGWPLLLSGVAGFACLIAAWRRDGDRKKIFLALGGLAMYVMVSRIRPPTALYAMPLVPLFVIYAAYFLRLLWDLEHKAVRFAGRLLAASVIVYTIAYSMSYLELFLAKNVRKEASEWIEKNIPRGGTVAVVKNYFWTPAILRQYAPPFQLITGGEGLTVQAAVLGLRDVSKKADYLVLNEFEYREFLQPRTAGLYPEQAAVIKEIFSGRDFAKAAEFGREASFLGFTFRHDYPPHDWLFPAPRIIILKNKRRCPDTEKHVP